MLALKEGDLASAISSFDAALELSPRNARAHLGKGLGLVSGGHAATGAASLEQAAHLF